MPPPTDPVELLRTPLARSGLTAAGLLRRAGIRLGWYDVRDLLFHLPRRYDDLRELSKLGDLVWAEEGSVVSARARVVDIRVEGSWRRRVQRTIARLSDPTGQIEATWFGRRFIERRLFVGAEIVVSGKVKHFGRRLTLDNPEFQVVADDTELLHAGRIARVREQGRAGRLLHGGRADGSRRGRGDRRRLSRQGRLGLGRSVRRSRSGLGLRRRLRRCRRR